MLGLYEPFLENRTENLLLNTRGWDKLAALIDGQAVNGFQVREAAGLLKVLVVVKSNYSYQVAARKTKEFNNAV